MADRQFRSITFPGLPNRYVVPPIENLAPAYSSASTYTVGDIVSYNNKIYRCIANITRPEGFSASHWTETTLGAEVEGLEEETGQALDLKLDKRTGTEEEVYTHNGATQGGKKLTETPETGAVPLYGTNGVLKAGIPTEQNDVVRKAELDEIGDRVTLLNQAIEDKDLFDDIPGTTQTVNFGADGKPSSIIHTSGSNTVRSDVFTWGTNTVTEVRTLADGTHITYVTNLETLVTTISAIEEAS